MGRDNLMAEDIPVAQDSLDKVSQEAVDYKTGTEEIRCSTCLYFLSPAACELVQGPISADGVSILWDAATTLNDASPEELING